MMVYLDRTFCLSPDCENKCGRKMTEKQRSKIPDDAVISWGFFCCDDMEADGITPKKVINDKQDQ